MANSITEIRSKFSDIMNYTGQGRDIGQFEALAKHVKDGSFLFVGCSNGDEVLDCQKIISGQYCGIDVDKKVIDEATKRTYPFPTEFAVVDIMKDNFSRVFDVVICRNLLIYYEESAAISITTALAKLTKSFLVIGISDPFNFLIKNDKVQIGDMFFEVVDFDNRIFRKL